MLLKTWWMLIGCNVGIVSTLEDDDGRDHVFCISSRRVAEGRNKADFVARARSAAPCFCVNRTGLMNRGDTWTGSNVRPVCLKDVNQSFEREICNCIRYLEDPT